MIKKEDLARQVLYRAKHRGCKETDFLIGNFVEKNLLNFSLQDLKLLSEFLQEDDLMIYDWILEKSLTISKYKNLVSKMKNFHKI